MDGTMDSAVDGAVDSVVDGAVDSVVDGATDSVHSSGRMRRLGSGAGAPVSASGLRIRRDNAGESASWF